MTEHGFTPNFTGRNLVIPDKIDVERDKVAEEWEKYGGKVTRIGRFWEPPELSEDKISLYGNHIFCMVLAQKLGLRLISPPDDMLINIHEKWLKRNIIISTIEKAVNFCYPCFIKPLVPKIFTAQKYGSYNELLLECRQLEGNTAVIYSDIVEINSEVRAFILNGNITTACTYEGKADIEDATTFLKEFIIENSELIPFTCVIDVGFIDGGGWTIIEANSSWGAGLNGCDPLSAVLCIAEATQIEEA